MKKALTIIVSIILFYIFPLSGNPSLIISYKIFILMIFSATIFTTQPALSIKEAEEKKNTDKNSIFLILLAGAISQIISVIEWGYFPKELSSLAHSIFASIGLLMMIGGILFRNWSIQTLGKFFTATVQIKDNQRIITSGPYGIVRHPSYLGAYVAIVGSTIFVESIIGFIIAAVGMGYAYKVRIQAEEETLLNGFGNEYRDYQMHTWKLIPCVW